MNANVALNEVVYDSVIDCLVTLRNCFNVNDFPGCMVLIKNAQVIPDEHFATRQAATGSQMVEGGDNVKQNC